jgi:hypothetical protein
MQWQFATGLSTLAARLNEPEDVGKIAGIDLVADAERLRDLDLEILATGRVRPH